MKRAGVIGHPLGHSLSPAVVQAAFDASGIDARYEPWVTTPEELEERVAGLRADEMLGANVTIPHKEAVAALLDRVDERAERAVAVNTIAKEGDQLVGYNTDVAGFERALREDAGFDPKGKQVAVLGAGGAARAIALALIEGGASLIYVTGRSPRRIDKLVGDLRGLTSPGITITWSYWLAGTFMRVVPEVDLLVNCTPVGTYESETAGESPLPDQFVPASIVFDLVYNPTETLLLKTAKARGAKAVSGLGMLVYQAAESFRIWTGQEAPVDKMLEAGRQALAAAAPGKKT